MGAYARTYLGPLQTRFEQLICRVMVRPAGVSPMTESWHRDEAPDALPADVTLGGWYNLDPSPQHFSCVPRSHDVPRNQGGAGFAKIPKAQHARYQARSVRVQVPPGHLVAFHEHIVHEVLPVKRPARSWRVFMGWRVTAATEPLDGGIVGRLRNQGIMKIKSNQLTGVYAQMHLAAHMPKLVAFSANFQDVCIQVWL